MKTVTRILPLAPLSAWLALANCGNGTSTTIGAFDEAGAQDDASNSGPDDGAADSGAGSSSGSASGSSGSSSGSGAGSTSGGGSSSGNSSSGRAGSTSSGGSGSGSSSGGRGSSGSGSSSGSSSSSGGGSSSSSGGDGGSAAGHPAGWLYTNGNKIYVSNGTSGTVWMGRGVNMDDVYLCGYDNTLWMTDAESTLTSIVSGLMAWKPTFVRVSLSMNSFPTVSSWVSNPSQYKMPMTNVINAIGANANVYVLVTLRSDASMVETDQGQEATYIPQAGTDATYVALVDSFANSNFVIFGLSNEPGTITSAKLVPVMSHAVSVIRAEEDRLKVPHHIVSVQGTGWTSTIDFYNTTPLPYDNVVYEVHGYPPPASSYTYPNIPVILGEYGSLTNASAFYTDVESKQIPNLAWDFEPYSDCAPDLLNVTTSATSLTPTSWGTTVKGYLTSH